MEGLQAIVDNVSDVRKEYKTKINAKKTKLIVISRVANKPEVNIAIDGTEIKQLAQFIYSGQLITEDGQFGEEIK